MSSSAQRDTETPSVPVPAPPAGAATAPGRNLPSSPGAGGGHDPAGKAPERQADQPNEPPAPAKPHGAREALREQCRQLTEALTDPAQPLESEALRRALLRLRCLALCVRISDDQGGFPVWPRLTWPAVIAVIGVCLLSTAIIIMSVADAASVAAQLKVASDSVTLRVGQPVELVLQRPAAFLSIRGAAALVYPQAGQPRARLTNGAPFVATPEAAAGILLDRVSIPRGALLTLTATPERRIELTVPQGPDSRDVPLVVWRQVNGSRVEVDPMLTVDSSGAAAMEIQVDEGLGDAARVEAVGSAGRPLTLTFEAAGDDARAWSLEQLAGARTEGPSFVVPEQQPGARASVLSGVRSGRVHLTGFDRDPFQVNELEHLHVQADGGRILSVALQEASVELLWEGQVTELAAGHPPSMRDLMPSVLEQLVPNPQRRLATGLVLYAILFAIGMLRGSAPDAPELSA